MNFWLIVDVVTEMKDYADEYCYYPTIWPVSFLAADHCNPYRLVEAIVRELEGRGELRTEFRSYVPEEKPAVKLVRNITHKVKDTTKEVELWRPDMKRST